MSGNFDPNYGAYGSSNPAGSQSFFSDEVPNQFGDANQPNIFATPQFSGASDTSQMGQTGPPTLAINLQFGPNYFGAPGAFAESPQQGSPNVASFFGQDPEQSPVDTKPSGRCDEKRPVCERCRKGSRECSYPEPKTKKKSGASKGAPARKESTESPSEEDESETEELDALPEESSSAAQSRSRPPPPRPRPKRSESRSESDQARSKSSTSSPLATKPPTPKTASSFQHVSRGSSEPTSPSVSPDQTFYLEYHQNTLTHHHYLFKHDGADFVHVTLYEAALNYDPLRYALVGFAAFHYTIQNPEGKISDFLTYYNQAVSLLRKSLQEGHKHTDAMLYTILQLAAFEEYLGDWVNLVGHQRAAHEMLLELHTPESLAATATGRTLLTWYARFDLFVGFMAGHGLTLDIEWFRTNEKQWYAASDAAPENVDNHIESLSSSHRILGVEMAYVNARFKKGELSPSDYMQAISTIRQQISSQWVAMERLMEREDDKVPVQELAADPQADEITGPVQFGEIMKGPLFSLNYMMLDWIAIDAMSQYQLSIFLKQPTPQHELFELAVRQMRVIDRIARWQHRPNGAMLPTQASLGLLSLFMPKDERYTTWCRRKLAMIECHGYIYPSAVRANIIQAFSMPSLEEWWFPEEDSCPPIIRSLRAFIHERTMKPRSQAGEDIRAMRAMFQKANVSDAQGRGQGKMGSAEGMIKEEDSA